MSDVEVRDVLVGVQVPRDDANTYVPLSWVRDDSVSYAAMGLLTLVVSYPPGVVVDAGQIRGYEGFGDRYLAKLFGELEAAGYLVREDVPGGWRWRLVHPARLGPLPGTVPA